MLTGAAVSSRLAGAGQGLFCNAAVAEGDVAVCDAEPLCAIVFDAGGCADDADGAGDDAGGSGVETGGAGGSQASAPSAQSSDADHDSACVASDVDDGSGACASDVCARCCAFVRTPAAEALVRLEAAVRATPPGDESARTALQSAADGLSAMLTEDGSPQTSEALRCACGVSYCSASCAKADAIGGHALLCGGGEGDKSRAAEALQLAQHISSQTNESLWLVARALARVALAAAHRLRGDGDGGACSADEALRAAWLPFAAVHSRPWWEVLPLPDAAARGEVHEVASDFVSVLREGMRRRIEDGWAQLLTSPNGGKIEPESATRLPWAELRSLWPILEAKLLTTDACGYLMGAFELNNLELVVVSPLDGMLDAKEETEGAPVLGGGDARMSAAIAALRPLSRRRALGSALYGVHSKINHSCMPNVLAQKSPSDPAAAAVLIALRDISPGEELRASYINEDAPFEERQSALRDDYGFDCKCEKCAADAETEAAQRRRADPKGKGQAVIL